MRVDISKPLKTIDSDVAQVCENGHVVNWFFIESPSRNRDFCLKCGKKTQMQCANCGTSIEGGILHLGLIDPDSIRPGNLENAKQQILGWDEGKPIPDHCGKCGQAFPWVGRPNEKFLSQSTPNTPVVVMASPGSNFHFGNGNINQQASWVELTTQKIDSAAASPKEKGEAKSLLTKISENKLLNTIIGSAVGELTKAVLPK